MNSPHTQFDSPISQRSVPNAFAPEFRKIKLASRHVRRTTVLLSLAVLAVLGWAAANHFDEYVSTSGSIVPNLIARDGLSDDPHYLSATLASSIQQIMVKEGESFSQGEALLQLDVTSQQHQLRQAQQRIENIDQHSARLVEIGKQAEVSYQEQLKVIDAQWKKAFADWERAERRREISIRSAEKDLAFASEHVARMTRLRDQKAGSQRELEQALIEHNRLRKALLVARIPIGKEQLATLEQRRVALVAKFQTSQQQTNHQIQSLVEERKARVFDIAELEHSIQMATITAPFDGVVLEMNAATGQWQPQGRVDVELAPTNRPLLCEAFVNEKEIGRIAVDQRVEFFPDTFETLRDEPLLGTVLAVPQSTTAPDQEFGDRQQYKIKIRIEHAIDSPDNHDDRVKIGTAGMCIIQTGQTQSFMDWFLESAMQRIKAAQ